MTRLDGIPDFISDKKIMDDENKGKYGDLYFLCMTDNFKTKLPEYYPTFENSPLLVEPGKADILVTGDSFLKMTREEKNFIQFLNDSLKQKVSFNSEMFVLNQLHKINFQKDRRRVYLLERVERHLFEAFGSRQIVKSDEHQKISEIIKAVIPYERDIYYQYLLQKSNITSGIYSAVANIRFDLFREIASMTPVYNTEPPWLFLYKDISPKFTSFYNKYTDADIDLLASNIKYLSDDLSEQYNLDLVFFPVPNKYSLYSYIVDNDSYNNLIPRLNNALEKKNVRFINIYEEFKNSAELLYYPTDTHWNPEGNRLVTKLFLEQMRKYGYSFN